MRWSSQDGFPSNAAWLITPTHDTGRSFLLPEETEVEVVPENFITRLTRRLIGVRVSEKVYALLQLRLGLSSLTNEREVSRALEDNAPDPHEPTPATLRRS